MRASASVFGSSAIITNSAAAFFTDVGSFNR